MVSFLYFFYNFYYNVLIYLLYLLPLASMDYLTAVTVLLALILVAHTFYVFKDIKNQDDLQFSIYFEKLRESKHYKLYHLAVYIALFLVFSGLGISSYGKDCIGLTSFISVISITIINFNKLWTYDGPAHKSLSPRVPKLNVTISPFDSTDFVLSTLYTIVYLLKEENVKGSNFPGVRKYSQDPKYSHIAWRIVENLKGDELDILSNYLLMKND
eukprot:TRINITY_DN1240_c0_g1_i1.p1 TRINITY_DN1240_c0_g1~~TRINITY_DN1240_c0_g1_i1.p1  ORF type:complete len:231 (-),score=37.22 TRINITY_DN1240_c0_g1_i1:123-764(-)